DRHDPSPLPAPAQLDLHDALPHSRRSVRRCWAAASSASCCWISALSPVAAAAACSTVSKSWRRRRSARDSWLTWACKSSWLASRSEEHTSELQSRENLVFRHLLEK